MTNNYNLPKADLRAIEALTPEQLHAIRININSREASDDETREAMAEARADGHEIDEFLA